MVKTRKHPGDARRQKYALDADAVQHLLESGTSLSAQCKELLSGPSPLTTLNCYEIATSTFDQCPICSNTFGAAAREPICLPCGHTICRDCTARIKQSPTRSTCPFDRKEFSTLIDALPINFAILSMIDSRTKIVKRLCCRHKKELIGFSPDDDELLCGVCLFDKKGQICHQFTSEPAVAKAQEKREAVQDVLKALGTQLELWTHCYSIAEVTLSALKAYEEASETKPLSEMANTMLDIFEAMNNMKKAQQAELEKLLAAWESLSFPEKMSYKVAVSDDIALAAECMKTMTTILKASR